MRLIYRMYCLNMWEYSGRGIYTAKKPHTHAQYKQGKKKYASTCIPYQDHTAWPSDQQNRKDIKWPYITPFLTKKNIFVFWITMLNHVKYIKFASQSIFKQF